MAEYISQETLSVDNIVILEKEKKKIKVVLMEAFLDDPIFTSVFINQNETNCFFDLAIEYVNTYGHIQLMDNYAGVSLWIPPNIMFLKITSCFKTFSLIKKSIIFLIKVKIVSFIKLLILSNISKKLHPNYPHYYLFAIGVANKYKGMGIGKRLMNEAFSKFGSNQVYYLENSNIKNLEFYNKLGFLLIKTNMFFEYKIFHMGRNLTKL